MMNGQASIVQQAAEGGTFDLASATAVPATMFQYGSADGLPFHLGPAASLLPASLPHRIAGPAWRMVDEPSQPKVGELVALLRRDTAHASLESFIDDLLARGVSVEHIYLRLFQPAARRLGELWLEDICSFVDVTLAMALLQSSLRRLAPTFQRHARPDHGRRAVLLATLDDDQHTFGLGMTAEFFRRSGWTVATAQAGAADALVPYLQGTGATVVGFSASRPDQCSALAAMIRRLRRVCPERIAGVLVGGPLFVTHPERAREVGADAVGLDSRQALAEAEILAAAGAWR